MRRARTTKAPIVIIEFSRYRSYFRLDLTCLFEKRKIVLVLSQWALETEFFWEACYGSCPPRGIPFELSGLKSSEKSRTSLTVSMNPLSLEIVETKVIVMGLNMSVLGTLLGLNVPMIE